MVRAVFDSVAPRYDLMNDLMSLGVHRVWKRVFVTALDPRPRDTLLDLAGGTGRHQLRLAGERRRPGAAVRHQRLDAGGGAGPRAGTRRAVGALSLLVADAERLPLPDRAVERVSIAFGLRNCTDKAAVLREARRVLKPGGRFCCLEFSRVQVAALQPLYDAWSFRVLPRLGRVVAKDADSYQYLAESIRTFPDQANAGGDDAGGGVCAGERAQPVGRHRGDSHGVAVMSAHASPASARQAMSRGGWPGIQFAERQAWAAEGATGDAHPALAPSSPAQRERCQ